MGRANCLVICINWAPPGKKLLSVIWNRGVATVQQLRCNPDFVKCPLQWTLQLLSWVPLHTYHYWVSEIENSLVLNIRASYQASGCKCVYAHDYYFEIVVNLNCQAERAHLVMSIGRFFYMFVTGTICNTRLLILHALITCKLACCHDKGGSPKIHCII